MTPYAYRDALLRACEDSLGIVETTRNSGPEIDEWLKYVNAKPGDPWCIAWIASMHRIAAVQCDVPNPCPRLAGALNLYSHAIREARADLPVPGDVVILDTGEPGGAGHGEIVTGVSPDGERIWTIGGNTNAAGSRNGDRVAAHEGWKPRTGVRGALVGFLRLWGLVKETPLVSPPGLPPSPF